MTVSMKSKTLKAVSDYAGRNTSYDESKELLELARITAEQNHLSKFLKSH